MPVRWRPGTADSATGRREAPGGPDSTAGAAARRARGAAVVSYLASAARRGAPSPSRHGNDAEGSWAWSSRPGASSGPCRPRTVGYDPRPDSPEPGGAARQRAHGVCVRRRMPDPRPGGVHRRTSGRVRMGRALRQNCRYTATDSRIDRPRMRRVEHGRVRMRRALGGVRSLRGGCPGPRPKRRVPVAERAGDHGACAGRIPVTRQRISQSTGGRAPGEKRPGDHGACGRVGTPGAGGAHEGVSGSCRVIMGRAVESGRPVRAGRTRASQDRAG